MSGHSKWSKIKHQKATTDVVRGKQFTKASRAIAIAVSEGGGITDPERNFKLRMAVEQAKAVNMPKDTIERAILKAQGPDAESVETVIYEAYGPYGVAMIIETATDNRTRTVSEIKNILSKHGGTLADPGSVAYQFDRRGVITISKVDNLTQNLVFECAIELGAVDFAETVDTYEIYTDPDDVASVKSGLEKQEMMVESMHIVYVPRIRIEVERSKYQSVTLLESLLDESDDVTRMYTTLKKQANP